MKLYELTDEMALIAENLEAVYSWEPDTDADGNPIDGDGNVIVNVEEYRAQMLSAWQDTLEAVGGDFDEKAGNIAAYIKNLKAEAENIHKEERALAVRRRVKEKALARITEYLLCEMERAGKRKIDTPRAAISVRNNPETVEITDERKFVEWAQEHAENVLKYVQPEIRKREVLALIKGGQEVPDARLTRTQSVIIK